MLKVTVNKEAVHEVEFENNSFSSGKINGAPFEVDIEKVFDNTYSVIKNNRSYTLEIVRFDNVNKELVVTINNTTYYLEFQDKYDLLLENLGMSMELSSSVTELKAPMPGLILDVSVEPGQKVEEGQSLIVLEAMKMENILKSPTEGTIKSIHVTKGESVEKNKILLNFE